MSDNQRDTIFISHATPEDNEFTIWLASRLQLLGYKVWIDKNALIGGEKFWEEIGKVIRHDTAKFLLVYSENICQRDEAGAIQEEKLKDGIYKEFSHAESISKSLKIDDFIILLNVDNAKYNLFIGADRLNQISFYQNWAEGFRQLEKKLVRDSIPKNQSIMDTNFIRWYEEQYKQVRKVYKTEEYYYCSWWPLGTLPEKIFIYKVSNEHQAKTIITQNAKYPMIRNGNCLCSFEYFAVFMISYQNEQVEIRIEQTFILNVKDVLNGYESSVFPKKEDAKQFLKKLLNRTFQCLMEDRKLSRYDLSNTTRAFFHTRKSLPDKKVLFEYPYRTGKQKNKNKKLYGQYSPFGMWHYAISSRTVLSPFIAFNIKNHLVFTDDGMHIWKDDAGNVDKKKLHSHRRKKASVSQFFNEEWRDLFLAFIKSLEIDNGISISLSQDFILNMPLNPKILYSDFGYDDPNDKSRHGILSFNLNDYDESDESVND